jgi:integrase
VASLTKRPTSKFWVACFIDRTGRRLKRSTAAVDRKRAQKIADAYEAAARRKRTALQVRRAITQLHQEISGDAVLQTSMREFLDSWLERKAPEIAPATLSVYRNHATKFLAFLGATADHDLTEITRDHITRFRNEEVKRGTSSRTVNNKVKFLRMVFRAAKRDALVGDDPAEFVDPVRKGKGVTRRPFTIPELKAVLGVADAEWRSMIMFGIYTGQRLADLASLTWQNVNLFSGTITLVTRKTGRTQILPIAGPLRRQIESLPALDDPFAPLHPRAFAILGKHGRAAQLSKHFVDLLAEAGLREKKRHRRTSAEGGGHGRGSSSGGLSFHCLRHTAVTMMKEAGIPAAVVMELVGHDSTQMSELYTHVGAEAMQKAADSLPDFAK